MLIESFPGISAIGERRWRAVAPDSAFIGFRWISFGERVYREETHLVHLAAEGNRTGAAVSSLRRNEPLPIRRPILRKLIAAWLRNRPLLSCQVHGAGVSGLLLHRTGSSRPALRAALCRELIETLHRHNGSFLLFPYLTRQEADHASWDDAFFTVSLPPGTFLPIRWDSFDRYLEDSKPSIRKDYRLHVNRALRLGLSTTVQDSPPEKSLALRLVRNVERRHRSAPNPHAASLLEECGSIGGKWLIVRQADTTVGCGLILQDRGEILLTLLGLEPGVQQVYFSLMYGAIRYAIENGLSGLHGGGGAYYFKSRLGYRLMENNFIKVYATNRPLRRFGRYIAGVESSAPVSPAPENARSRNNSAFGYV